MELLYVPINDFNRHNATSKMGHIFDSRNAPSYTELKPLLTATWYTVIWQNEIDVMVYTGNDMYDPPVYTYVEFAYRDGRKRMFNTNEIHVLEFVP